MDFGVTMWPSQQASFPFSLSLYVLLPTLLVRVMSPYMIIGIWKRSTDFRSCLAKWKNIANSSVGTVVVIMLVDRLNVPCLFRLFISRIPLSLIDKCRAGYTKSNIYTCLLVGHVIYFPLESIATAACELLEISVSSAKCFCRAWCSMLPPHPALSTVCDWSFSGFVQFSTQANG